MKNQEPGNNLFCIYRDCEDLALFGDYCKAHQFQRAEAAEARAAELEKYLDLANAHALRLMQERDDLRRESDKFADSLNLECAKVIDLCRQLEQAQRKIDAYDKADRALNQALNEGDGVYRP